MASLHLKLSPSAERALRVKIAEKAGRRMRAIVENLHDKILKNTAFNTGRTLGSWYGSADRPFLLDIGAGGGFGWNSGLAHTNRLPVGEEGAARSSFEKRSMRTTESINFEKNPYRIFYITNGASLDSGNDFAPGINSDLNQGPGSRAYYQEYGTIAGFNLFASSEGQPVFDFAPRGTNALERAVNTIRGIYARK